MMNKIDGKYAVVTGSTQGLGAAIAQHFAKAGAAGIITCGRSIDKGEALALKIKSETDCDVYFVQADLSSVADCRKVIAKADERFGGIDILVNAAGVTDRGNILDTDEALFDRMFAINTRGPFFLMQDTIKLMIRDNTMGAIVNIGSASAMAGQPFISAYCASKGALATLTKNTAYATLRNKIRVNQLNIGWMASDGEHEIQTQYHGADENWLEKAAQAQPFERLLDPIEVAKAVTFLASNDAGMMTGSVINFDQSVWGGYSFAPPTPNEPLKI